MAKTKEEVGIYEVNGTLMNIANQLAELNKTIKEQQKAMSSISWNLKIIAEKK